MADQAFVVYRLVVEAAGGTSRVVPLRDFTHDLEAMAAAVTPRTRLVFLGNPNNPTGTIFRRPAWEAFLRAVPRHLLVVADDAYAEYVDDPEYPDTIRERGDGRVPVLSLRTFSKLYGLAGLRIGYGVAAAPVIDVLDRIRQPFNVNALALAGARAAPVRAGGLVGEVVGFGRTEANLRLAEERGLADRVTRDPAAAVAGADAIVLATPVGTCAALAAAFRPHARAGALLTDVGSVKQILVAELEAAWAGVGPVVGAHPIAGSEASGAGAARADLFRGRRCILTPTPAADRAALARVRALWEGVGARVEEMPPAVHDELLARVSHLPHLLAYALVAAVGEQTIAGRRALDYAGTGFRDTTRVAASPPELWCDIALANAPAPGAALGEFRAVLDRLERLVGARDAVGLAAALAAARALRGRLRGEE